MPWENSWFCLEIGCTYTLPSLKGRGTRHLGEFFHCIAELSTKSALLPPYITPADLPNHW
jgi:hypothetical protein